MLCKEMSQAILLITYNGIQINVLHTFENITLNKRIDLLHLGDQLLDLLTF